MGNKLEIVIISDRCTSIKRFILKVFYDATHGIFFYHIKGNIKSKFRMSKTI